MAHGRRRRHERRDLESAFLIHSLGAFSNMTDREIRCSQRTGARDCLQPVKRPSNVLKRLEPPLHSFWVTAADSNYDAFFLQSAFSHSLSPILISTNALFDLDVPPDPS